MTKLVTSYFEARTLFLEHTETRTLFLEHTGIQGVMPHLPLGWGSGRVSGVIGGWLDG